MTGTCEPPPPPRIAALDVAYRAAERGGDEAHGAALFFDGWAAERAAATVLAHASEAAPYRPGAFFLRELPVLLDLLARAPAAPEIALVDGYAVLDRAGRPGLGARLFDATGGAFAVAGVAKSRLRGDDVSIPVRRGRSRAPLFVTAIGVDAAEAAAGVAAMAGAARVPRLLAEVDRAARSWRAGAA